MFVSQPDKHHKTMLTIYKSGSNQLLALYIWLSFLSACLIHLIPFYSNRIGNFWKIAMERVKTGFAWLWCVSDVVLLALVGMDIGPAHYTVTKNEKLRGRKMLIEIPLHVAAKRNLPHTWDQYEKGKQQKCKDLPYSIIESMFSEHRNPFTTATT